MPPIMMESLVTSNYSMTQLSGGGAFFFVLIHVYASP